MWGLQQHGKQTKHKRTDRKASLWSRRGCARTSRPARRSARHRGRAPDPPSAAGRFLLDLGPLGFDSRPSLAREGRHLCKRRDPPRKVTPKFKRSQPGES